MLKSRKPKFANVLYQTFELGLVVCFEDPFQEVSLVTLFWDLADLCRDLSLQVVAL